MCLSLLKNMSPGGFRVTAGVMETGLLEVASDHSPVALRCLAVREALSPPTGPFHAAGQT